MHLRRAAYQCFIWKSAGDPILSLPQPVVNEWIESGGLLSPEYMVLNSVPESDLEYWSTWNIYISVNPGLISIVTLCGGVMLSSKFY